MNYSCLALSTVMVSSLSAASSPSPRQTICFNQDWRFRAGHSALPGRVRVENWRHQLIDPAKGEAGDVNVPSADSSSGEGWQEGGFIRRGEDTLGREWEQGGNLGPRGSTFYAWICSEIPGVVATEPTLEFESINGIAHIYVNGIMLRRYDSRRELCVVDLAKAWKDEGINSIAVLIESKDTGGIAGAVHFLDKANVVVPADNPISPDYDDSQWRTVEVPHDYIVEGPITELTSDGYKRDWGWYRKTFAAPAMQSGSRVWLEFDGVYRMARFWLNGRHIGDHPTGYIICRLDITDALQPGENTLVIQLDPRMQQGWWYDGAGIYRAVRMIVAPAVHVEPDSVFVKAEIPDPGDGVTAPATLTVESSVNNTTSETIEADIVNEVLDSEDKVVARSHQKLTLTQGETVDNTQEIQMPAAQLWSTERPVLYRMRTTVKADNKVIDQTLVNFGIRKIEFCADRGFLLNGKVVKLKGVANHESHAGVGVAIPDRLHIWRLEQMKKMGANAYRCAAKPHSPVIYHAADRMGILVLDEFREFGDNFLVKVHEKETFDHLTYQRIHVKRNRNHPSIILWGLTNEQGQVQNKPVGAEMTRKLMEVVNELDGTRLTTAAVNHGFSEDGICSAVDVIGFNYHSFEYDRVHALFPDKPKIGTESSAELSTRGYYERTRIRGGEGIPEGPDVFGDVTNGWLTAYSENRTGWGELSHVAWKAVAERPWMAGYFIWTGMDYKGEPTPFAQPKQPSISSYFGIMDICGFPKDVYWYYKSWWTDEPVIHVFPHWNWQGREGETIKVWVHSNCETVELFLNGKSLGRKTMEINSYLEWDVEYAPGKLEARGVTKDGKEISAAVETTDVPAGVALAPDRTELVADGQDLAWVGVSVIDDKGRVVPTADNMVRFSVTGPGIILGVGNGNPASHEPDKASQRSAFHGYCMVLVQTTREAGEIVLKAESEGLAPVSVTITSE